MGVESGNLDSPLKTVAGYAKRLPETNPDDTNKAQRNQRNIGSAISSPPPKESEREKIDLNLKPKSDPYKDIVSIGESSATDKKPPFSLPPAAEKFAKPIFGLVRAKAFGAGYRGTF